MAHTDAFKKFTRRRVKAHGAELQVVEGGSGPLPGGR
jgi:hypothetical protein